MWNSDDQTACPVGLGAPDFIVEDSDWNALRGGIYRDNHRASLPSLCFLGSGPFCIPALRWRQTHEQRFWKDAEIIHAYTRRQAIEDGVLVDLMQPETTELVGNAGLKVPVAMTATAFARCVWPIENAEAAAWLKSQCQDLKGRLWDVLWMFRCASRGQATDTVLFEFVMQD